VPQKVHPPKSLRRAKIFIFGSTGIALGSSNLKGGNGHDESAESRSTPRPPKAKKRRQGISIDALLERLINERAPVVTEQKSEAPEVPVWPVGVIGSLHRRDIYNDVPLHFQRHRLRAIL
jgi:hypothetical protein